MVNARQNSMMAPSTSPSASPDVHGEKATAIDKLSPPDSPNSKASPEAEDSPKAKTLELERGHELSRLSLPMVTPGRFPRSSLALEYEEEDEDKDMERTKPRAGDEDFGANGSSEPINTALFDEDNSESSELILTNGGMGDHTPQQFHPTKRSLTELDPASPSPQTSKIVIYPSLLEDVKSLLATIRHARSTAAAKYADTTRAWTEISEQAWADLHANLTGDEGENRITFKDIEDDITAELSRFLTAGDGIKRFKVNVVQGDIIHAEITRELESTKALHAKVIEVFEGEEDNATTLVKLIKQRLIAAQAEAEAVRQRKDKKMLDLEKELKDAKAEIREMKENVFSEGKAGNGGGFGRRLFG
ncbi:hypothetical protein BLS_006474 [Venturia inaequalis]|uniref:Uncharacterized protein n=1 Tax=Venturia inaequalis TaxID=5025 RepID=A0A8H3VA40_VENIN|nr:hypothetical protein BLS_006474 [Venturia inaequalis]KAE9983923.1 hypothetical protein EG328_009372 [Venturia inaequalis]KAE9991604.1 hypothetical protein EG327_011372 [Venturia inaequalis]RDI77070.1 hypothetical protein Vi05172_g12914 [Venturia inaequalis]